MRGYFAIGVEGISKAMNVGSLFRSAHAFGASFVFTVAAAYSRGEGGKSDTSDAPGNVPFYSFPDVAFVDSDHYGAARHQDGAPVVVVVSLIVERG